MKNSVKSILFTVLLASSFILIYSGCEKENTDIDDYGDPIVSTTGKATVGKAGGTISVGDQSSAIYGASIEIPKDAVDEAVTIEIVPGVEELINGELVQTVDFLPKGLEFYEQVEIGIPWTIDDQNSSNSKIYYFNDENFSTDELTVTSVDVENKITYGLANHFSSYFNGRQYYVVDGNLVRKDNQFMAYVNLYTPLVDILPRLSDSPFANAEEIVTGNDGMQDCFAKFTFYLFKQDNNRRIRINQVARQDFYIKYNETTEGWNAYVYRYDNPSLNSNQAVEIFHKSGLTYEQLEDDWLSGFPIVASFNENCFWDADFTYDSDDKFEITGIWGLVKQIKPSNASHYWTTGCGVTSSLKTFSQLEYYQDDINNNNIDDNYEGNNTPPTIPSNPQPVNYVTNVSINTDIQWTCSDPDGDDLSYKIYFGTTSSPLYIGTTENITAYTPSGLTENTTYFWYIEATDPDGLSSTSQVWEFTTESASSSPCNGITSVNYEGQIYNTVEIGEQCWFKENINVGTRLNGTQGGGNNGVIDKYCFEDDPANCDTYGGLYKWDEMMQYVTNEGAQGICPDSWHIPSRSEWYALVTFLGEFDGAGGDLKESGTAHWNSPNTGATNASGFGALPGGYLKHTGSFHYLGEQGHWGSSTENSTMMSSELQLNYDSDRADTSGDMIKAWAISVRCIKD